MKYTISINQRAVVEGGHNIDFSDCAILDFLIGWAASPTASKRLIEGILYVWVSKGLLLDQVPMLRQWSAKDGAFKRWSRDTLYRRLKVLEEGGYIAQEVYNNRSWVAVLPITYELYGTTISKYDQLKMERKGRPKSTDLNPYLKEGEYGCKSESGTDLNPTNKNIELKEIKKETLQRKEPELQRAENENPATVIDHQEVKEVPAPLPFCKPPVAMSGDKSSENPKDWTVSGWGRTIPWDEIKDQAPPAEPDFYWWFEKYGKNVGSGKCEGIWAQHVDKWADIAWHTVFFVYFRTFDTAMIPEPLKYLRDFKYRDDIDDRRPKAKPTDIKAEQDAPIQATRKLNFGGQD